MVFIIQNLFNIFSRKLQNGKIVFYYYIYDTNGQRKQYSTGMRTEVEAYQECLRLAKLNQLNRHSSLLFRKYCANWFDYAECEYIQTKLLHGFTYSRTHARQQRGQLLKHAIPFFGDKALDAITAADIEAYIRHLKEKNLTNTSINHNLKMLRLIFGWAERKNTITHNSMNEIINLKSDTKEKGMFTEDEAAMLLLDPAALATVWEGNEAMYLLNLTAYKTGMRLGEIQAFRKEDIQRNYVTVQHSLDRKYGLKSTKTGKIREIPISADLQQKLHHHTSRIVGTYVFGMENGIRPVRHDEVYSAFYNAAAKIGLNREVLRSRCVTFHSYRHALATRLTAANVPEAMIRAITGHSAQAMLNHYTHIGIAELRKMATCFPQVF